VIRSVATSSFAAFWIGGELTQGRVGEFGHLRRPDLPGALERAARSLAVTLLPEQPAQPERRGGLASLLSSPEGGLGALEVPFLLEHQAEVVSTDGLAPLVRSLVCGPAAGKVAALLQQYAEV
jgi:hypothetical protein